MKKWFTHEQIIGFLKQAGAGTAIKVCRKHGFSDASSYLSRRKPWQDNFAVEEKMAFNQAIEHWIGPQSTGAGCPILGIAVYRAQRCWDERSGRKG